jgi:hypothetical protein
VALCRRAFGVRVASSIDVQTLRFCGFALLVCCRSYDEYVPVTNASLSTAATHAMPISELDASGELPSTAEGETTATPPVPGVLLPFFPFFPIPQVDIGRGYDPREPARSPAYGPGGSR